MSIPVAARPAAGGPARRTAAARQPKYLRIYDGLRERIAGGRWPVGSALPSQHDLADEFGVSIMTLRQALQLLADDGIIETRHGSGTFVAARYSYDLGHLRSFAADLAAQGAQVTTRLLAADVVTPPEPVADRLGATATVLALRRLRLAGGRPLIVQMSYLPVPLTAEPFPARIPGPDDLIQALRPGDSGLYSVLASYGLAVTSATETITPVTLGPRDARDLARPEGSPALLSHRLSFTASGSPVVDDHALLPGDSVAITASRSPDRLDVRYALAALA